MSFSGSTDRLRWLESAGSARGDPRIQAAEAYYSGMWSEKHPSKFRMHQLRSVPRRDAYPPLGDSS